MQGLGGAEGKVVGTACGAVKDVVDDGGSQPIGRGSGGVEAELVGAAGGGLEADAGLACVDGEEAPAGGGGLALEMIDDLVWTPRGVEAHGAGDDALVVVGDGFEDGGVVLFDGAGLELGGEGALGFGSEAEDEDARGVHVEAVDDERAGGVEAEACGGGAGAGGGAVLLVGALAGDGEHAGGLDDDEDVLVGVEDGDVVGGCGHSGPGGRGRASN